LQRSRKILYKPRMADSLSPFRRRFFRSLHEASELLRLFEFLPRVYLYVKDADGRFVAMNQALVRMRGATSESELIGKTDLELHPIYWGNLYREEDLRVIESDRPLVDQVWLVPGSDGQLRSFVSSKIPLHDRNGRCIGIAGVMYPLENETNTDDVANPVEIAVEIISARFHQPLEVKKLAAEAGLSVSQLNRRFRARYQMSPSEYLQRVRVHEACRLLVTSHRSVADIAHDTGFYDQAHFSRTFRRWRGMSPSQFRKAASDNR